MLRSIFVFQNFKNKNGTRELQLIPQLNFRSQPRSNAKMMLFKVENILGNMFVDCFLFPLPSRQSNTLHAIATICARRLTALLLFLRGCIGALLAVPNRMMHVTQSDNLNILVCCVISHLK